MAESSTAGLARPLLSPGVMEALGNLARLEPDALAAWRALQKMTALALGVSESAWWELIAWALRHPPGSDATRSFERSARMGPKPIATAEAVGGAGSSTEAAMAFVCARVTKAAPSVDAVGTSGWRGAGASALARELYTRSVCAMVRRRR